MGLLKAKDLLHHIDRLQDFIILEAAEDADGNVSRDEIEHNLISCLQIITGEPKFKCYQYLLELTEYKQRTGWKDAE